MMIAMAAGAAAHLSGGWPARYPEYRPVEIAGRSGMREGSCFLRPEQPASAYAGVGACTTGAASAPRVVVWGDSFAAHLVPGLSADGALAARLTQVTASGCPPVGELDLHRRPQCRAFNAAALELIARERPAVVVIAARWEAYLGRPLALSEVQRTVRHLRRTGVEVVLVGQSPSFDFASPYDAVVRSRTVSAPINFDPVLNEVLARIRDATFFDPLPVLCQGRMCRLEDDGGYLYFDGGHLSALGTQRMGRALAPVIATAIERSLEARVQVGRLSYLRAPLVSVDDQDCHFGALGGQPGRVTDPVLRGRRDRACGP